MSHLRIAHISAIAQSAVTTYKKVTIPSVKAQASGHGAAEERGMRWGNSQLCGDQIEVQAQVQAQLVVQAQLSTAITTMKPQDQLQLAEF